MTKIKTTTSSASTSTKTNGKIGVLLNHGETKKKAGRKKTARKIISKIDAMKPKKPPPAFFYFLQDFRKEYQEMNPDIKSMCHEKVKYYDIATEKRAEFDRAMVKFTKRKESGDFDEDESDLDADSDFDG